MYIKQETCRIVSIRL